MPFIHPVIRTPITDFTFMCSRMTRQTGHPNDITAKLEMRWYDCMEAYGSELGKIKCHKLYIDFLEARYHLKEEARANMIQIERKRQYKQGKLKDKYMETPPYDSYYWTY